MNGIFNCMKKFNQKLLYVEDHDAIRNSMSRLMGNVLFENPIDTAENGLEGLELFKENRYNLIITDIAMPKMNGVEMSKKIREINKDIPIIFLTGFNEEYINDIEFINNSYLLTKPLNLELLVEKIKGISHI